jgi:hypothetical protein
MKNVSPKYRSYILGALTISALLISLLGSNQRTFAQMSPSSQPPLFSELPPYNYNSDRQDTDKVAAAIANAGPIADAARILNVDPEKIKSLMTENFTSDQNFFLMVRVNSVTNQNLAKTLKVGDHVLVGLSREQVNNQMLNDPAKKIELRVDGRVMGLTEKDALEMSGQGPLSPPTRACDNDHNNGDIANRWCHAAIADSVNQYFLQMGVNPILSVVLGAIPLLIKEYFVDLHPSKNDLPIGEIRILKFKNPIGKKDASVYATAFADGAIFVTVQLTFD